jgi:hypothetical protein
MCTCNLASPSPIFIGKVRLLAQLLDSLSRVMRLEESILRDALTQNLGIHDPPKRFVVNYARDLV